MAARKPSPLPLTLTASEFTRLIAAAGPFEHRPVIAVAVSGGIDSMALLLLAQEWAEAQGGKAVALTVDHGLRPESAEEARQIGAWCGALGLSHQVLQWQPGELSSGIQMRARQARYDLLTGWCRSHHVLHLLTAHHQGDQAETLFFRLARGSQIDGLACMPSVSVVQGVRLVRPLLSIAKPQLEATLAARGQAWLEDPSNQNDDYTRNRIRHALEASPQQQEWQQRAADLAFAFGGIRHRLDHKLAHYLAGSVSIFAQGYGIIHHKAFLHMPEEMGLRALSALATTLSGEAYAPRSEKLARFYEEMRTDRIRIRRSFAGLLFIRKHTKSHWLVCREPNALEAPLSLADGEAVLWDKRFLVSWAGDSQHMRVRALGYDGIKLMEKQQHELTFLRDKPVLAMLPSFWHLEELAAVPHIDYASHNYRHMEFTAAFSPAKALAADAFFSMNT